MLVRAGSHGDATHPYTLLVEVLDNVGTLELYAEEDTYVAQGDGAPHGAAQDLLVGRDELGQEQQALFRFDLNDLPPCLSTIASAAFMVTLSQHDALRLYSIELMGVTGSWNEDTLTWPFRPDMVSTGESAEVGNQYGQYYQWDATNLVQGWLDAGVWSPAASPCAPWKMAAAASLAATPRSWAVPSWVIHAVAPDPGLPATISGRVYDDANGDGNHDAGEAGIANIPLEVSRDAVSLGITTTGADGTYTVGDLPAPGFYMVAIQSGLLPLDYELLDAGSQFVGIAAPGEVRSDVNFRVTRLPTPTPTPPTTLNLTAAGMEVIQVIQGADLIAGKTTLVRVYIGVSGVPTEALNIDGVLFPSSGDPDVDGIDPIAHAKSAGQRRSDAR